MNGELFDYCARVFAVAHLGKCRTITSNGTTGFGESISLGRPVLHCHGRPLRCARRTPGLMMSLTRVNDSRARQPYRETATRAGHGPGINYSAPPFRTRRIGAIHAYEYEYEISIPRVLYLYTHCAAQ